MSGVNLNDILTSFYLYFSSREVSDNNSKSVHLCVSTGSINIYRFHVLLLTFKRCDFYKIFYTVTSLHSSEKPRQRGMFVSKRSIVMKRVGKQRSKTPNTFDIPEDHSYSRYPDSFH